LRARQIHRQKDFGFPIGITIIVVCLTVSQIAYLIGKALAQRGPGDQ
jgi:hypothetical protein